MLFVEWFLSRKMVFLQIDKEYILRWRESCVVSEKAMMMTIGLGE